MNYREQPYLAEYKPAHPVINLLIHHEFANCFVARLIIEKDKAVTENWRSLNCNGHYLI